MIDTPALRNLHISEARGKVAAEVRDTVILVDEARAFLQGGLEIGSSNVEVAKHITFLFI